MSHKHNHDDPVQLVSRRSFCLTLARTVTVAGLAAAGGFLINRRLDYLEDCYGHRICGGCGVYNGCELPYKEPGLESKEVPRAE